VLVTEHYRALGEFALEAEGVDADDLSLQRLFKTRNWTDGLPVVVPTRPRIDGFLEQLGFASRRLESLGPMAPSMLTATVENVAVNAFMAGCEPEHLGIVLGAVEAMLQPSYGLGYVSVASNPVAPFVIVNGPKAVEAGVASGAGAFSPRQSANGPIGRAVRLVMRNVGGTIEGIDATALGQPLRYTCCLAEAEAASPWEPHHVIAGYEAQESVVTVAPTETLIGLVPSFDQSRPFRPQFVTIAAGFRRSCSTRRKSRLRT
jgi:hypothetical protein